LAIVEPSGFHTFMAIAWSVLAAVQLGAAYYVRREERRRAQASGADTITR
jgi:cytochrome oxidase assembly protein ShyY1